jgi:hypothetical protein
MMIGSSLRCRTFCFAEIEEQHQTQSTNNQFFLPLSETNESSIVHCMQSRIVKYNHTMVKSHGADRKVELRQRASNLLASWRCSQANFFNKFCLRRACFFFPHNNNNTSNTQLCGLSQVCLWSRFRRHSSALSTSRVQRSALPRRPLHTLQATRSRVGYTPRFACGGAFSMPCSLT